MQLEKSPAGEHIYVKIPPVSRKPVRQEDLNRRSNARYRMQYMTDWKRNLQLEIKNYQRLYGMLGFAQRAGKLVIGTELICSAIPHGSVKLVLVSHEASENTKKKLFAKSEFYGILAIEVDIDTERLGKLLGKTYAPAAVAVADEGFANEIKKVAEV